MSSNESILSQGSLVFVTGANGFISSHVVDQLLERGYRVRGTVRDADKSSWVQKLFDKRHGKGKFELAGLADYTRVDAYTELLKDVSGIIQTVGVTSLSPDPNKVIPQTIAMTTALLEAALSFPSIKRFIFTSSSVAITFPKPNTVFPVNANVFNDAAIEAAWAPPPYTPERSFATYAASKLETEYAVKKFVSEKQPHFAVNSVLPNTTLGEILDPAHQDGSTTGLVVALYTGGPSIWRMLPPQYFISVKDVARLFVAALTLPGVEAERLLGFALPMSQNGIKGILRKLYPGKEFEADEEGEGEDKSEMDSARSLELVRKLKGGEGWDSLEVAVKESVQHLEGK